MANPAALYSSTIADAQWRLQVRAASVPGAQILLDSENGVVTYVPGSTPLVVFQWPTSAVASLSPAYGCAFDFGFILPDADFELAGSGTVNFVSGVTQAGVTGSPAAPALADDTWTIVGAYSPPIATYANLTAILAALQPAAIAAALCTLDPDQIAALTQAIFAGLLPQTGPLAPVPTGEAFVDTSGFVVKAQ